MSLICIDNGSLNIKLGFQNNDMPYITYHNKGIKQQMRNFLKTNRQYFTGPYCDILARDHMIEYPIHNGVIKNWDLMYDIWDEIFSTFTLFTKQGVITSHADDGLYMLTSINYRQSCYEKIMKFVFENYKISKLQFGIDSINSLYSIGRTNGIVIDSGESFTRILSIFQGHLDNNKLWQMEWAGRNISDLIRRKVLTCDRQRIYSQENVDTIKQYCYYDLDNKPSELERIKLPDSSEVDLSFEKTMFPNKTFTMRGQGDMTMTDAIIWCLEDQDQFQKQLQLQNIFPTGGNTLFKNFDKKLNNELKSKFSENIQFNVFQNPQKINSTYLGSNLVSQTSGFNNMNITRKEWEENGTSILMRKKMFLNFQQIYQLQIWKINKTIRFKKKSNQKPIILSLIKIGKISD